VKAIQKPKKRQEEKVVTYLVPFSLESLTLSVFLGLLGLVPHFLDFLFSSRVRLFLVRGCRFTENLCGPT
jgi:hypothetical protein